MAKTFHLTIAKVGETLFSGEAISATVPGSEGELTVLAGHEAFVTTLKPGSLRVQTPDEVLTLIAESDGVLEVSGNQATVIL